MNDVVQIPPTDKWLGSCPECGKSIWESYRHIQKTPTPEPIYRCIECKYVWTVKELIPF